MKQLKDLNSDVVEDDAQKVYDNPDDIDWQNDVPEDDREREAWLNEHCSDICKQKLNAEYEAELKQRHIDYEAEVEKVKKLLVDPEFIALANANDDIDESKATVFPTTNSQKVIEFALKQFGAKEENISFVIKNNLAPIDDSFRFYFCKLNGNKTIVDPTADKIYTVDNCGNFRVGCAYYSFDESYFKTFLEKKNDKYFYANRYLTYTWKTHRSEYTMLQKNLSTVLGYRANRDFK